MMAVATIFPSIDRSNWLNLQHCAKVLLEFNGGSSCVQIYVNQHTFFIGKSGGAKVPDNEEL
jgi:exocyst complex component 5